jgi:hypothetical protein
MNFLFPAFLIGAVAVAIPIVLHLLRRDVAPDVPFTAVRLLRKSPIERSRRRRLRDLLLLAARVAALILVAAAFARPYAPRADSAADSLRIVAVDRSFSMGAPGQFDSALALARTAIDEAGFTERVALIAFDERAEVLALPGGASDARSALKNLAPGSGGTRYASVIEKASELAAGAPARLVFVTDLQRAGWEGEARSFAAASLVVDIRSVAAPSANVGIADVRVDAEGLLVTVRNNSRAARRGSVTIVRDGSPLARVPYDVPAESTSEIRPPARPALSGSITARLDDAGGFPADDSRHFVMKGSATPTVLVVSSGDASGFFLLRALEAAGGSIETRPVTGAEIAGGRAKEIANQAAVVLLSTRNLDRAARDGIASFVRGGGGLLIAAAPEVEPGIVAAMFGWDAGAFSLEATQRQLTLAATDVRHPLFRPFGGLVANLGQITFHQAWRVRPEQWQVPARFSDGSPAVLDRTEGAGRIVLFASDLDRRWNDFPVHPAFVPFAVEALRYLSARREQPQNVLVAHVPAGIPSVPGIQKLPNGRSLAVNVDTRESSIAVMSPQEFEAAIEKTPAPSPTAAETIKAEQTEARQNLWQYGLMLMLVALVAESFVGRP